MSSDRSIAGAEWVSAPTEMRSTPVSAMARTRSRLTLPLASSRTRPLLCARLISTASAMVSLSMLSSITTSASAFQGFAQFRQIGYLDFHPHQVVGPGARSGNRRGDAARGRNVVFLD